LSTNAARWHNGALGVVGWRLAATDDSTSYNVTPTERVSSAQSGSLRTNACTVRSIFYVRTSDDCPIRKKQSSADLEIAVGAIRILGCFDRLVQQVAICFC
jgi:hypothetical protein